MKEKQTSVDWLFHKLWEAPKDKLTWLAILEQSSIMYKEEIVDAVESINVNEKGEFSTGEEYYNEKFNNELES
jgi:hypothetical protein